jgi:hypothetical protein
MSLDFVVSGLLPWLGLLIGAGLGLAALAAPKRMLVGDGPVGRGVQREGRASWAVRSA